MSRNVHNPDDVVIVTIHVGLVEWLARRGIYGRVFPGKGYHGRDIKGKIVFGRIPFSMVNLIHNKTLWVVELPSRDAASPRGELTADQMDECGAVLAGYKIEQVARFDIGGREKEEDSG